MSTSNLDSEDLSDPTYYRKIHTVTQMHNLVKSYHERLAEASKQIVGTAPIMLQPSTAYKPQDARFLSGSAGSAPAKGASAPSKGGKGGPSRPRTGTGANLRRSASAALATVDTDVVDLEDEEPPAKARPSPSPPAGGNASPAPAKHRARFEGIGKRSGGSQAQMPVVLTDLSKAGVIDALFVLPGKAATFLTGKHKSRGEADPEFILLTSIACGNQVAGVLALAAIREQLRFRIGTPPAAMCLRHSLTLVQALCMEFQSSAPWPS